MNGFTRRRPWAGGVLRRRGAWAVFCRITAALQVIPVLAEVAGMQLRRFLAGNVACRGCGSRWCRPRYLLVATTGGPSSATSWTPGRALTASVVASFVTGHLVRRLLRPLTRGVRGRCQTENLDQARILPLLADTTFGSSRRFAAATPNSCLTMPLERRFMSNG